MQKILLQPFAFVIFTVVTFAVFLPQFSQAQSSEQDEVSFLRAKIQLLQSQIELLKAQISLLSRGVQPTNINCAQLNISWERVSGANSYRLYRDGLLVYEGSNLNFTDSKLTLNKKYKYVVYGLRSGVQGAPSEVKEIQAPNTCPPPTPRLSAKAEPCGGNVTLTWSHNPTDLVYQLFRTNRQIYSGPLATFVDSRITPGAVNQYKIRAGNGGGWSNFSALTDFQASGLCASLAVKVAPVVAEAAAGKEAILLATMRSFPGNNARVKVGTDIRKSSRSSTVTYASVMAFEVEALISDVTITRVDLFFESPIWVYLDRVELRFGGRTVGEKLIKQESLIRPGADHIYQLRFDSFSALVQAGRTATFTVRVDGNDLTQASLPHNIKVFLENNSIRGVDKAGISQFAPLSGGGKDGAFSRVFRIEPLTTRSSGGNIFDEIFR